MAKHRVPYYVSPMVVRDGSAHPWAREWALLCLLVAAIGAGCGSGDGSGSPDARPSPDGGVDGGSDLLAVGDYFDVIRGVRQAVRTSPDHLPARAERLVDEGDARSLFAFVRDEIALIPDYDDVYYAGFDQTHQAARWGARATLRSGMGTAREKADLLTWLLERAGHTADVVGPYAGPEIDAARLVASLGAEVAHPFAPQIDEATTERWIAMLDPAQPGQAPDPSAQQAERDALRSELHGRATGFVDRMAAETGEELWGLTRLDTPAGLPIVRATIDGVERTLNPAYHDATFEESYDVTGLDPLPPASTLPVEVSLLYARSVAPTAWQEAVTGSWSADELAGRRVQPVFAPTSLPSQVRDRRIADIQTFVPGLVVQGADLDEAEEQALSVVGEPLRLTGERVPVAEGATSVRMEGADDVLDLSTDPTAPDRVANVEVRADASEYPRVVLNVRATDGSGVPVERIGGEAFRIFEEGEPRGGLLLRNHIPTPKVLFLLDLSTSVPAEFRDATMVQTIDDVAQQVWADHPQARLGVAPTGTSDLPAAGSLWTSDAATLTQRAEATIAGSHGTDLWNTLATAFERFDPTLVVFVTDGEEIYSGYETVIAEAKDRVRDAGAPAVVVATPSTGTIMTPEERQAELTTMAALSDGELIEATAAADVPPAVLGYLNGPAAAPYRIEYRALPEGPTTRTVEVAIGDGTGSTTYEATAGASSPISRLALRVRVGDREVTRILAGPLADPAPETRAEVPGEVRSALAATTHVVFEPVTPPTAVWMDDYLGSLLTRERALTALVAQDAAALWEALDSGEIEVLPLAPFVAHPQPTEATGPGMRTYPSGMQTVVYREHQRIDTGQMVGTMDILPTAGWRTVGTETAPSVQDERRWAVANLTRTLGTAHSEAAHFEASTLDALDAEVTTLLAPSFGAGPDYVETVYGSLAAGPLAEWKALLTPHVETHWNELPQDGAPQAFLSVHEDTGEALAVLAPGIGGGETRAYVEQELERLGTAYSHFGMYTSLTNVGAMVGVVAIYGQALARWYGVATIAVAELDAHLLDEQLQRSAIQMGCEMIKALFLEMPAGGVYGVAGQIYQLIDHIMGVAYTSPFSCAG